MPTPPQMGRNSLAPKIAVPGKSVKEQIALLTCTLMIQVLEMNQEIKCKNPTVEKVVLAGFCLVPVSPPFLQLLDWFCHTGAWVVAPSFCIQKILMISPGHD